MLLGAKAVIATVINDVPFEVEIQLQRNEFLVSKVIFDMPDEAAIAAMKAAGKDEAAAAEKLAAYHKASGPMLAELERRGILARVPCGDTAQVARRAARPARAWHEIGRAHV